MKAEYEVMKSLKANKPAGDAVYEYIIKKKMKGTAKSSKNSGT